MLNINVSENKIKTPTLFAIAIFSDLMLNKIINKPLSKKSKTSAIQSNIILVKYTPPLIKFC